MPTWEELDRGYYDPRLGTYMTSGRVDWPQTARQSWATPSGGLDSESQRMIGQMASGYYDPSWGTYITPGMYDWRYLAGAANLPMPQTLALKAPQPWANWGQPQSQTPMPQTWDTGGAASGSTSSAAGSGQTGRTYGTSAPVQPRMGALGRSGGASFAGQQEQQPEQPANPWGGRHPPNAVYISDDGLVSYDAAGYRLDSIGNRALGDPGAHLWS